MDLLGWSGAEIRPMLLALGQIILIDVVMSGDNALMIGMTTQGLEKSERKKAIFFGVVGAMVMRIVFAFGVAQLLQFSWIKIIGALLLFGIAVKLYKQFREKPNVQKQHKQGRNWLHALWMIVLADVSMSLDNILAVASAAEEHLWALIIGIIISIILMTTIATLIARLLKNHPRIERGGFAVIVFLAFKMLLAGINTLVAFDYQVIWYRVISMSGLIGIIVLHRVYMSDFEAHDVTKLLYQHAPFIITVLLLMVAGFLAYGDTLHARLEQHHAVRFTLGTCLVLLLIEMISLERVKHKVKIGE